MIWDGVSLASFSTSSISLMGENVDRQSFEAHVMPNLVTYSADTRFATIFENPEHYMETMDVQQPHIRVGQRITEAVLTEVQSELRTRRIRFLVVLVPTKHRVYADLMREQPSSAPKA
jgi:hypothetical protein